MRRRTLLIVVFTFCFVVLLCIFAIGAFANLSGIGFLQSIFSPLQTSIVSVFHHTGSTSEIDVLKQQNLQLSKQLTNLHLIEADNKALHDQFQTTSPSSTTLLPVTIVGMPDFIPGVTLPDSLIIGAGKNKGVSVGQTVVYKNQLIGVVQTTNSSFSKVQLITANTVSFAAKTAKTGAVGIVKGFGSGQLELDNVVLSDTLQIGDMVVTNPDISENGKGFPPGLIIGKITSIEKRPSDLFQKAHIQVLTDITKLPIVFVMMQ